MAGKLYLSGGGAEEDLWKILFKNINRVLYIPLAWPNDDFESCLEWFKEQTRNFKNLRIDMVTDSNKPVELSSYDLVFVGGGNTFKLLKRLRESGFEEKLIDYYNNGGSVYGGSAGAIIWGNTIETALICKDKDKNEVKLKNIKGFNKINNYDIQCHFEPDQVEEHQEYITKTGRNVIAIPEGSFILVESSQYNAKGKKPITVITKENSIDYQPDSVIHL
tara:strand:- start:3129 stop:3788 length:660 start_codon:yes stop_codon:yes gene_type:complete